VVAGKRLNGRAKKSGEEKSRKKVGAPGILLLTDQFRMNELTDSTGRLLVPVWIMTREGSDAMAILSTASAISPVVFRDMKIYGHVFAKAFLDQCVLSLNHQLTLRVLFFRLHHFWSYLH